MSKTQLITPRGRIQNVLTYHKFTLQTKTELDFMLLLLSQDLCNSLFPQFPNSYSLPAVAIPAALPVEKASCKL